MAEILSSDRMLFIYGNNRQEFRSVSLKSGGTICISKEPVYLEGLYVSLSLFFGVERLEWSTFVAESRQTDDRYRGMRRGHLHDAWLYDLYGEPDVKERYGLVYSREGYDIYSEHEPEGNDVILVRYDG